MEEYFTKAIELYKKSKRTQANKKEMKEVYHKYQLSRDYGEINTPTQIKLDRLFNDIRREIFN